MKSRKFDKKLLLGKMTIVDLNNGHMEGIQGGKISGMTCPYCPVTTFSDCTTVCGGPYC